MKKVLVLGATGGSGSAIVAELLTRGVETVAFGRSQRNLDELVKNHRNSTLLQTYLGDVFRIDDITAAAQGADVIVQASNVPYQEMESKLIPLGTIVMQAANRLGVKVVIVDGIYSYGRKTVAKASETHPKHPHTRKGKIRLAYEQMIFSPQWNQAQPLIVRLPDYYGPTAKNAYLSATLEAMASGKLAMFIGSLHVPREYVYLPDAAKMIVELASREQAYGQNWHIPGPGVITGHEIIRFAREVTGVKKPVLSLGKGAVRLTGLFSPMMKEVVEMMYLTEDPFILSGEKYEKHIGPIPATSYEQGFRETIMALMNRSS
jgi:nucleoside-diphosphate-sugar epimerase